MKRRDFIQALLAGACLGWPSACGMARGGKGASSGAKPFFFVQLADPQIPWGTLADWQTAIRCVNRLRPPLAIVCGDMVNDAGSEAEARDYLKAAGQLDPAIALHHLPGNHDVGGEPPAASLAWFEKHFGKPWSAFTHGNCQFITLESNCLRAPTDPAGLAARQMAWLRRTLAEGHGFAHRFVFMHHPMALKSATEPDDYFNMPQGRRAELLRLFHAHGVRAVFSGHYHQNAWVRDGELELITTASTGKALGRDPLGFRIVKVYPERIEHAYYGFAAMPAQLAL